MRRAPLAIARRGFTLVEMMISMALLSLISILLLTITNQTSTMWKYTSTRSEQFTGAGAAFDSITNRLSQATLNTYWDYDNPILPTKYQRKSELRFLADKASTLLTDGTRRPGSAIFFQAPLGYVDSSSASNFGGLPNLLNTWGYYLEFAKDQRPPPVDSLGSRAPPYRYRYRLMEMMEPSNLLSVYNVNGGPKDWYTNAFTRAATATVAPSSGTAPPPAAHVLAENVIQLVFQPKLSKSEDPTDKLMLSPAYRYDSYTTSGTDLRWRNQLPPVVQVTMVVLDEASASRMARGAALPGYDSLLDAYFSDARKYDDDLKSLQAALVTAKLNFRVFTTNVSLRSARWSAN